jgi:hypothetical protein
MSKRSVRVVVYLTDLEAQRLRELAQARGNATVSQVVREEILKLLTAHVSKVLGIDKDEQ